MNTVSQPSFRPTNKLGAATVATAMSEVSRLVVMNYAPDWYDPGVWAACTPLLVFGLGYLVPDQPNVETGE